MGQPQGLPLQLIPTVLKRGSLGAGSYSLPPHGQCWLSGQLLCLPHSPFFSPSRRWTIPRQQEEEGSPEPCR